MPTMKRSLIIIAVSLSALICIASVLVWARSWLMSEQVIRTGWDESRQRIWYFVLAHEKRRLYIVYASMEQFPSSVLRKNPVGWMYRKYRRVTGQDMDVWTWWWFERHGAGPGKGHLAGAYDIGWKLGLPLWPIVLLTAIGPSIWFIAMTRRRRRGVAGHCRRCGYDLRASPDRCPECGRPTSDKLVGAHQ